MIPDEPDTSSDEGNQLTTIFKKYLHNLHNYFNCRYKHFTTEKNETTTKSVGGSNL